MWNPIKALEQSFMRTKAANHEAFQSVMKIRTNSSNNTVYTDADGTIAYYHGNFIPKRDTSFDYTKPVDGSNPETDWNGLHTIDENILVVNPANGWIQNCNSTPFSCAASNSPKSEDYPVYMASFPENYRGVHAVDLLSKAENLTLNKLINLAYDPYIPLAGAIVPCIIQAYESVPDESVRPAIDILSQWDYKTSEESIGMTLLRYYLKSYQRLNGNVYPELSFIERMKMICTELPAEKHIEYLTYAMKWIESDFGTWRTPWGEINRYQRINGNIRQPFNDSLPSIPIGMGPGHWGALASFGARSYEGTKRQYGTYGNSFVAVVEFGNQVNAKTLLAGGQSGNPDSPHFDDQVLPYANCKFKTVAYYRKDVLKQAKSTYYPGEK